MQRKKPFEEPAPTDKAKVYKVTDDRIDVVTQKYTNNSHISVYRKLNKNEVINTVTGEVKEIKHKEKQDEKAIFAKMQGANKILERNFKNGRTNHPNGV